MNRTLLVFALLFACPSWLLAQPKFSVDRIEVDFGIIYNGAVKTGKFELKNIGDQPLKILGIQPSCGCTTVKQPKNELKPGESDFVEVEFNASGYRGKVEKYITITTNDPTAQYPLVKLKADVREELEPNTHSSLMWFGNITVGKTQERTITFRNVSDHQITVRNTAGSSPRVAVKFDKKTLAPSDSVIVTVVVTAEKPGYANDHFLLQTDSKNQPKVEMKVSYIGVKEN